MTTIALLIPTTCSSNLLSMSNDMSEECCNQDSITFARVLNDHVEPLPQHHPRQIQFKIPGNVIMTIHTEKGVVDFDGPSPMYELTVEFVREDLNRRR